MMRPVISAFVIMVQMEYVESTAYDFGGNKWKNADLATELSSTYGKVPTAVADKDYKLVTFSFAVDQSKIEASKPTGFLYNLKVNEIVFELFGLLPENVRNKLAGKSSSKTPGQGTVHVDCPLTQTKKTKFQEVGVKGKLIVSIERREDQTKGQCDCSEAKLDHDAGEIWQKCGLDKSTVTENACKAMKAHCDNVLKENGQL